MWLTILAITLAAAIILTVSAVMLQNAKFSAVFGLTG